MNIFRRINKKKLSALIAAGVVSFGGLNIPNSNHQLPITHSALSIKHCSAADIVDLNLDETVQRAFANNRTIKQSIANRESAYWSLSVARRQSNPTVSWSGSGQKVGGKYYPTYNRSFSNTAQISMPVYTGGQLEEGRESARLGLNSADLELEQTLQTVRATSTNYYYYVLQCRNQIQVEEEAVNVLQEHLDNVNAQFRVGTVAKSDVLASQVQLAEAQQDLVNAQNNFDNAVADLCNYIGLPADTVLRPRDQLTYTKYIINLEDCTKYALDNSPECAIADYAVKEAECARRSAKSGYRPTVNAAITKNITGVREGHNDLTDSWSAALSANWNIFDGGVTSSQVHQADSALARAKENAAAAREAVQVNVQKAFLDLFAAEKNIAVTKIAVDRAEEDYKIAQVRPYGVFRYAAGVDTTAQLIVTEIFFSRKS